MEPEAPPKKSLFLVNFDEDQLLEYNLRSEGYSVTLFDSGEETLKSLLLKEPDLLILIGFPLRDMTVPELTRKVNETLPNRKVRLIYMHPGDFHSESDIKWNVKGVDVAMPRYFPNEILPPILRKVEAMNGSSAI